MTVYLVVGNIRLHAGLAQALTRIPINLRPLTLNGVRIRMPANVMMFRKLIAPDRLHIENAPRPPTIIEDLINFTIFNHFNTHLNFCVTQSLNVYVRNKEFS